MLRRRIEHRIRVQGLLVTENHHLQTTSKAVDVGKMKIRPITNAMKTKLAKRLLAIRQRIIAKGTKLLNWSGVAKEIRKRR